MVAEADTSETRMRMTNEHRSPLSNTGRGGREEDERRNNDSSLLFLFSSSYRLGGAEAISYLVLYRRKKREEIRPPQHSWVFREEMEKSFSFLAFSHHPAFPRGKLVLRER